MTYATEIYSHRGAAGLFPENTIEGYSYSLDLGVDALDIDVAMTKDGVIVGSHDPFLNKDFTRDSSGNWLANNNINIIDLTFDELMQYDVGSINPNSDYYKELPDQKPLDNIRIPSLDDVILLIKNQKKLLNKPIKLQIEIKTEPGRDSQEYIEQFVDTIITTLEKHDFLEQAELQSFDWRSLLYAKKIAATVKTSFISQFNDELNVFDSTHWTAGYDVKKYNNSLPKMIAKLGGDTWCPDYKDLTKELVAEAHAYNIRVVPWTADTTQAMEHLIALGVDGIITNRPDILKKIIN